MSTPGPWRIATHGKPGYMVCIVPHEDNEWYNQYIVVDDHMSRDTVEKDALLIQAAPELLVALRGMLDAATTLVTTPGCECKVCKAVNTTKELLERLENE